MNFLIFELHEFGEQVEGSGATGAAVRAIIVCFVIYLFLGRCREWFIISAHPLELVLLAMISLSAVGLISLELSFLGRVLMLSLSIAAYRAYVVQIGSH